MIYYMAHLLFWHCVCLLRIKLLNELTKKLLFCVEVHFYHYIYVITKVIESQRRDW